MTFSSGDAFVMAQTALPLEWMISSPTGEAVRILAPTLESLGRQGIAQVDLICPGFPADCLETLEEIAIEGRATFIEAGGRTFNFIPCLNERDDWIAALADLAATHLQGWPTRCAPDPAARAAAASRAIALGASA